MIAFLLAQIAKLKAAVVTVVDNLTSTSATNALSANQGRILDGKISDLFVTAPISGNTDSGGNKIVSTSTLKVVAAIIDGYIAIPFYNNGSTYVKVLNWGTLEPVTSTEVTGIAIYIKDQT